MKRRASVIRSPTDHSHHNSTDSHDHKIAIPMHHLNSELIWDDPINTSANTRRLRRRRHQERSGTLRVSERLLSSLTQICCAAVISFDMKLLEASDSILDIFCCSSKSHQHHNTSDLSRISADSFCGYDPRYIEFTRERLRVLQTIFQTNPTPIVFNSPQPFMNMRGECGFFSGVVKPIYKDSKEPVATLWLAVITAEPELLPPTPLSQASYTAETCATILTTSPMPIPQFCGTYLPNSPQISSLAPPEGCGSWIHEAAEEDRFAESSGGFVPSRRSVDLGSDAMFFSFPLDNFPPRRSSVVCDEIPIKVEETAATDADTGNEISLKCESDPTAAGRRRRQLSPSSSGAVYDSSEGYDFSSFDSPLPPRIPFHLSELSRRSFVANTNKTASSSSLHPTPQHQSAEPKKVAYRRIKFQSPEDYRQTLAARGLRKRSSSATEGDSTRTSMLTSPDELAGVHEPSFHCHDTEHKKFIAGGSGGPVRRRKRVHTVIELSS